MPDDVPALPAKLIPVPVGLNAEFYEHTARGELCFQLCDDCDTWRHPPRFLCAACGSARFTWKRSSRRGRVFSWTVTHQAIDPAFADELPYAVLVVQMDEGVRVVGGLRGLVPAGLALDLAVVAELDRVADTIALVHFRPA